MKVRHPLLSVLIMGSMSVLGLSEDPSNGVARKAVCKVRCENAETPVKCRRACNSDPNKIPVLDIEAKANAKIICRSGSRLRLMNLDYESFIVEVRNLNSDWDHIETGSMNTIASHIRPPHLPAGRYQLRFTRVFPGGISRSDIKEFTMPGPDDELTKFLDIWVQCFTLEILGTEGAPHTVTADITAEIGFKPVRPTFEIPPCYYGLTCTQDQGNYNRFTSITYPGISPQKKVFNNLLIGKKFTFTAEAEDGTDDLFVVGSFKFSTPSDWPSRGSRKICVPDDIEDLETLVTHRNEIKTNIYDVRVTWRKPHFIPDLFIVNITSDGQEFDGSPVTLRNESGKATETTFRAVNISQQFNVSIRGWSSLLGGGPMTSRFFTVPDETVDLAGSDTIITATLTSSTLLVVTGVFIYLIRRRLRRANSSKRNKDEIDPDRLTITRVLGSGAFGVVKFGRLRGENGLVIDVAVKMLRDDTNDTELRNFRVEIEMMKSLGKHPNIISFVGYRTTGLYPFLVVEYCPRGDLLSFLRAASLETKPTAVAERKDERYVSAPRLSAQDTTPEENSEASEGEETYIDPSDANRDTNTVTVLNLLNFGRQIATGMEFLSSKRIVHRDLAARNILVCDKRVVKISDFGLSRNIYRENMYRKTGNGRMPFKWMAIESLIHQIYTTQSDVWSFGILLWEIFTLGSTPYPEIPTLGILKLLQSGYRMERPENCTEALYNVMLSCWKMKPKDRPTFALLRKQLDQFIGMTSDREYLDADYIFAGMPFEGDFQTSSPCDTSIPLQEFQCLEPPIIEAEACVEV